MELKDLSSNWKKLQQKLKTESSSTSTSTSTTTKRKTRDSASHNALKRRKTAGPSSLSSKRNVGGRPNPNKRRKMATDVTEHVESKLSLTDGPHVNKSTTSTSQNRTENTTVDRDNVGLSTNVEVGKYIAIDCEMVGVGPNPDRDSALARVSIVNYNGDQVYDSFVRPKEMVTDWRTHVSGVTPKHMIEARTLEQAQKDVAGLLDGRILVGHAVRNDLDALLLGHPKRDIRDTSKYPPYRRIAGGGSPRLKILAKEFLGLDIQGSAHSSVEDARATILLFRRDKDGFEKEHAKKWPIRVAVNSQRGEGNGAAKKKKKAKKGRK